MLASGVLRGEDGHTRFIDLPLTIDLGSEGKGSSDHTEAGTDQLTDDDKKGEGQVLDILLLMNVDARCHSRVEVASRDASKDQDHSEKGEGHGELVTS